MLTIKLNLNFHAWSSIRRIRQKNIVDLLLCLSIVFNVWNRHVYYLVVYIFWNTMMYFSDDSTGIIESCVI